LGRSDDIEGDLVALAPSGVQGSWEDDLQFTAIRRGSRNDDLKLRLGMVDAAKCDLLLWLVEPKPVGAKAVRFEPVVCNIKSVADSCIAVFVEEFHLHVLSELHEDIAILELGKVRDQPLDLIRS
jgi:hypothetical protein